MFSKRKIIKKNVKKNLEDVTNNEESVETICLSREKEEREEKGEDTKRREIMPTIQNTIKESKEENDSKMGKQKQTNERKKNKKKDKILELKRKKEEETSRINRANTSFNVYSDDENEEDNNTYVVIKKKKKPINRFKGIGMKTVSEGNRKILNSNSGIHDIKESSSEKENNIESNYEENESFSDSIQKCGEHNLLHSRNESDSGAEERRRVHEHNYNIHMNDEYDGIKQNKYDEIETDMIKYDIPQGIINDSPEKVNEINSNYKNGKFNENMFIQDNLDFENVALQFEEDNEYNMEEQKLIENIRLKKRILRKKNELYGVFNEEGEDYKDEEEEDIMMMFPSSNSRRNGNTTAFSKSIRELQKDHILCEDDLDMEDVYNYETVNEMKKRLLIKQNRNQELNTFYENMEIIDDNNISNSAAAVGNHSVKLLSEEGHMVEEEKINKIVTTKILNELKEEQEMQNFIFTDEVEKELHDNEDKKNVKSSSDIDPLDSNNDVYTNKKYHKKGKTTEVDKCNNEEFFRVDVYNKKNERMIQEIENAFEDHAVCNTQIIKLYEYIKELYAEYEEQNNMSINAKEVEANRREEYNSLMKKNYEKKREIIVSTVYLEFIHTLYELLEEKQESANTALEVLNKLEQRFHVVYQHLKLYLYKPYYEKYKLAFTNEYIFNSKYYRRKKKKDKSRQFRYLKEERKLIQNINIENIDTIDSFIQMSKDGIYSINGRNSDTTGFLYLYDGFSSNYSSDYSSDTSTEKRTEDVNYKKDKINAEKKKYFQTEKMKRLKEHFLVGVNQLFNDTDKFFLNLKNCIRHFILLKQYNYEVYTDFSISSAFDEILIFFTTCELLYWDPMFQFSMNTNQKKQIYESNKIEEVCTENNNLLTDSLCYEDPVLLSLFDEKGNLEENNSSCSDSIGIDLDSSEDEMITEEENKISEGSKEQTVLLYNNELFKKKKYQFRSTFCNNPSVVSFEWFKFVDEFSIIYEGKSKIEIVQKVYDEVLSRRIFELVQIWNPLSYKQSMNLYIILREFCFYNRTKSNILNSLITLLKEQMNIYIQLFIQCYQMISDEQKIEIFLMRCFKFFKCVHKILILLSRQELFELVKKVYTNFVLPNYMGTNSLQNNLLDSIMEIMQLMNISDVEYNKEVIIQMKNKKRINNI